MNLLKSFIDIFIEMTPYLLLGLTISGFLHVAIKKEYVVKHVGKNNLWSIVKSALLGVPLPLCSCGVIPTGAYLKKSGASNGSVMSFLISTPQTGVDSIAATYAMLGPFYAIYRPIAAFFMGIIGGIAAHIGSKKDSAVDKDRKVEEYEYFTKLSLKSKLVKMAKYAYIELLDDLSTNLIIGIALAALITFFIPEGFLDNSIFSSGFLGMLLMVVIGIPMYVCSTSSIPIAAALIAKGLSPGAAYVFLIAGPATNMAAITILYRVLGLRQTVIFLVTIVTGSFVFGGLMNIIAVKFDLSFSVMQMHAHQETSIVSITLSILFAAILILSLVRGVVGKHRKKLVKNRAKSSTVIGIDGMTCHHCEFNVGKALESVTGVTSVKIDLLDKKAYIDGKASIADLKEAIKKSGYKVI